MMRFLMLVSSLCPLWRRAETGTQPQALEHEPDVGQRQCDPPLRVWKNRIELKSNTAEDRP
jgi:hypothetical protein